MDGIKGLASVAKYIFKTHEKKTASRPAIQGHAIVRTVPSARLASNLRKKKTFIFDAAGSQGRLQNICGQPAKFSDGLTPSWA